MRIVPSAERLHLPSRPGQRPPQPEFSEGVVMPISKTDRSYALPPLGENPSSKREGTTPGSFALRPAVGAPRTFSSPDTPGMPPVSEFTAMDFGSRDRDREGKTQLEEARAGVISPEMRAVAARETHLTAE